jgi:hypothetical protein
MSAASLTADFLRLRPRCEGERTISWTKGKGVGGKHVGRYDTDRENKKDSEGERERDGKRGREEEGEGKKMQVSEQAREG